MKLKQSIGTAARNSIRGWELQNHDPELFDLRVVEVFGECAKCPFLKFCSTPSDSIREIIPRRGHLVELGRKEAEEEDTDVYFALILEEETRFILLRDHKYYWADISYISGEQVPTAMR